MAWTVPVTAIAGQAFTAAMWNASLRDNLLETELAKATGSNQTFATTALNAIAARTVASATVSASQTTTATTYSNLATVGPAVTLTTGTNALIILTATIAHNTAGGFVSAGYAITGATTFTTPWAVLNMRSANGSDQIRCSGIDFVNGCNPGSNTFTMKYLQSGGTATFISRNIIVWPL